MPPASAASFPARLLQALHTISQSSPRLIAPPATGTTSAAARKASVAIIIRLRREHTPATSSTSSVGASPTSSPAPPLAPLPEVSAPVTTQTAPAPQQQSSKSISEQLDAFFSREPWIQHPGTTAEICFIKRATRATDKWSGHVAFPGGREEPEDPNSAYTAIRETWEEIGLDLADPDYLYVGALDDREITTSLGKRLLMILSPHVFLHTSPYAPVPELQESEVASAHWIPLDMLVAPKARYGEVVTDLATRLAPRNAFARAALKMLVGSMRFTCILLPNEPIAQTDGLPAGHPAGHGPLPELKLWGLTLGMTLDLLSNLDLPKQPSTKGKTTDPSPQRDLSTYPHGVGTLDAFSKTPRALFAPSMASIFPKFSYPDINLLIWLFGYRYRRTLKSPPPPPSARVNWAGMSIGSYYAAVRRALVVAIVFRALALVGGVGWLLWKLKARFQTRTFMSASARGGRV